MIGEQGSQLDGNGMSAGQAGAERSTGKQEPAAQQCHRFAVWQLVQGFEGARTELSLFHGDLQSPCDVPFWRLDDEGLPAGQGIQLSRSRMKLIHAAAHSCSKRA